MSVVTLNVCPLSASESFASTFTVLAEPLVESSSTVSASFAATGMRFAPARHSSVSATLNTERLSMKAAESRIPSPASKIDRYRACEPEVVTDLCTRSRCVAPSYCVPVAGETIASPVSMKALFTLTSGGGVPMPNAKLFGGQLLNSVQLHGLSSKSLFSLS